MTLNMIRLECKKAVFNKFFLLAILIGCGITASSFVPDIQPYYRDLSLLQKVQGSYNPCLPLESLFNHWIGSEAISAGSGNFFFIFPLLIAIPYGWSYCAERRSGYLRSVVLRAGRLRYYGAKYLAVFVSGGLAMVIPLLFNFLVTALFVPAVTPDPSYITGYGISGTSLLSLLFYTRPFLYIFLYLLLDFAFCGLLTCLCFALAAFIKSRVAVVVLPLFILLAFQYFCNSFIYASFTGIHKELSPMYFLRPVPAAYDTSWAIIGVEAAILFLFTFFFSVVRGARHEIY